jgi:hypothetical protein
MTTMPDRNQELNQPAAEAILAASSAAAPFLEAVAALRAGRLDGIGERIRFNRVSPPVKVLRTLLHLLHAHPDWAIETVELEGFSGCSEYVGKAVVAVADGSTKKVLFAWDCAWKADEMSWRDAFGFPDQIRAARTFDWNCFRQWQVEPA